MKQIPLLQGRALLIELPKQDFIKAKMQFEAAVRDAERLGKEYQQKLKEAELLKKQMTV